jgi:hypothetical protein
MDEYLRTSSPTSYRCTLSVNTNSTQALLVYENLAKAGFSGILDLCDIIHGSGVPQELKNVINPIQINKGSLVSVFILFIFYKYIKLLFWFSHLNPKVEM